MENRLIALLCCDFPHWSVMLLKEECVSIQEGRSEGACLLRLHDHTPNPPCGASHNPARFHVAAVYNWSGRFKPLREYRLSPLPQLSKPLSKRKPKLQVSSILGLLRARAWYIMLYASECGLQDIRIVRSRGGYIPWWAFTTGLEGIEIRAKTPPPPHEYGLGAERRHVKTQADHYR